MHKVRLYCVYIMANQAKHLYIGVTNNLQRRVLEHKQGLGSAFTAKYKHNLLVYFEPTDDVIVAIEREKQLKGWRRSRKLELIRAANPRWRDLSLELFEATITADLTPAPQRLLYQA